MTTLSKPCIDHLLARWDEGVNAGDDQRFAAIDHPAIKECNVIELDINDMSEYPELRGYTAVALSEDGEHISLTREEADDDEE